MNDHLSTRSVALRQYHGVIGKVVAMNMNAMGQVLQTVLRAAVLLSLVVVPAIAMGGMRAGDESIIEGSYKTSSGAGLVLVISLQRAH